MVSRLFRRSSWFVIVAALTVWAPIVARADDFAVKPYLQNLSPEAVTIVWQAANAEAGPAEVSYAREGDGQRTNVKAELSAADPIHKVRLTGLIPATQYAYQVRQGESRFAGQFKTAPGSADHVRFAIIGDSRFWNDEWETSRFPGHLLAQNPEFIVHMGDMVLRGTQAELWPAHFKRFGDLMSRLCMFPVRGNHEGDGNDPATDWFSRYHDLPGGEPLTSFDWGGIHFTMISCTHADETAKLLEADLAKTSQPWKIAVFHYPVYTTGYYGANDGRLEDGKPDIEAVCDKYNVDLVVNAHTHIYERCFPMRGGQRDDVHGTIYLVQGGDVGGNYPARWTSRLVTEMDRPHYTTIDVTPDALELRTFGNVKGDRGKGKDARIIEVDRYVRWRDEANPRALLAKLDTTSGQDKLEVIRQLGAMVYAPAAEKLLPILASQDEPLRRAAALALEDIANTQVASAVLKALSRSSDEVVQAHLARALEKAMPAELASPAAKLARDPRLSAAVRVKLIGAVVLHAPAECAFPVAFECLADATPEIRHRAADAVKRTAAKADAGKLLSLFEREQDDYVAANLAYALGRLTHVEPKVKDWKAVKPNERAKLIQSWQKALGGIK